MKKLNADQIFKISEEKYKMPELKNFIGEDNLKISIKDRRFGYVDGYLDCQNNTHNSKDFSKIKEQIPEDKLTEIANKKFPHFGKEDHHRTVNSWQDADKERWIDIIQSDAAKEYWESKLKPEKTYTREEVIKFSLRAVINNWQDYSLLKCKKWIEDDLK